MLSLLSGVDRFLEAATVAQKWRVLKSPEKKLRSAMSKAFKAQGKLFLKGFAKLQGKFQESLTEKDWIGIFDSATQETVDLFGKPLEQYTQLSLLRGAESIIAQFEVDSAFNLSNPRAVAYLEQHGFGLINGINEVTRGNIATIITNGAAQGWSYSKTATEIRSLYGNMSRKRAQLIAVTETGNGYEAGSNILVRDLAGAGLKMEKSWLTVGDANVSEGCRTNAADGWIPVDESHDSGDMHPLRFPGCRCTELYRRARG